MSKEYAINMNLGTCVGREEVTKIPKSHMPPLEKGYQIVITVPFITKAVAQSMCDKFIKHGLQSPPLRDDKTHDEQE